MLVIYQWFEQLTEEKILFFTCIDVEFGKCVEQNGIWAFIKCRKEVKAMNNCLTKW